MRPPNFSPQSFIIRLWAHPKPNTPLVETLRATSPNYPQMVSRDVARYVSTGGTFYGYTQTVFLRRRNATSLRTIEYAGHRSAVPLNGITYSWITHIRMQVCFFPYPAGRTDITYGQTSRDATCCVRMILLNKMRAESPRRSEPKVKRSDTLGS